MEDKNFMQMSQIGILKKHSMIKISLRSKIKL